MTEKEILNAILYRLDEMSADIKAIKEEQIFLRKEMNERFDKVDGHLEHLAHKWIETDREVFKLKSKQA
ncbi:hypothetical protein [Effusibacillus consociatus]|uniref:Uncharacterized protein n=1 Tax=Effusibacillus consociatus TaxID=1117041 RepID=A0ABV9Q398_9BACL